MKRLSIDEYKKLINDAYLIYPELRDKEIANESGIDASVISRYGTGERHAAKENQEKIIRAIITIIERYAMNSKNPDVIKKAFDYINQAWDYIYQEDSKINVDDEDDIDDEEASYWAEIEKSEDFNREHRIGFLDNAEKEWEQISKKDDLELLWLDKYYDVIDRYYRMELKYIKKSNYSSVFENRKNEIIFSDEIVKYEGLKKTINLLILSKYSFDRFKSSMQDYIISENEKDTIHKNFIRRIIEFEKEVFAGAYIPDEDLYFKYMLDENNISDDEYRENLPECEFIKNLDLMLSISSEDWLKYFKYRLYVIKSREITKDDIEIEDYIR